MRVVLEIASGPFAGRTLELWEGKTISVGRARGADFVISHDNFLSSLHFSAEVHKDECVLRDLGSSNGTFLNQILIQESRLKHGDTILAGATHWSVSVPPETESAAPTTTGSRLGPLAQQPGPFKTVHITKDELPEFLTSRPDPLFGVLDAARDSRVLNFLRASEDVYQSLYHGEKGEELATVAPYLVNLPKTSALLPKLIDASWGESWGVFLTSSEPFPEVRKHLRRFLTATAPDGSKLFFRFYDPRVLRVYIPTCTTEEQSAFLGQVRCFLMEGDDPEDLLVFPASRG